MDTVLIISMAMIFMTVIQKSGALEALNAVIVSRFHKVPAVMLILLMLIIMFPGMITGSSTAAVLSAGAIVAPILLMMGIPAPRPAPSWRWAPSWAWPPPGEHPRHADRRRRGYALHRL